MSDSKTKRNVNIEILRVIAMFMIVLGHCIGHSHLNQCESKAIGFVLQIIKIFTLPATNIFILISSFFLVESQFRIKKVCTLWVQVLFFSMGGGLFNFFIISGKINLTEFIKALLPISGNQYWFVRTYFGLYIFSPFLNIIARRMTEQQFRFLLVILLMTFSVWPSLIPFATTWNSEGGNGLLWFVTLYFIGAYIRLYVKNHTTPKHWFLMAAGVMVVTVLAYYSISFISNYLGCLGKGTWIVTNFTTLNMTAFAVLVLIAFISMKSTLSEKTGQVILFLSSSTFSVYLIHENMYIRGWMWKGLNLIQYTNLWYLPVICVLLSLVIFLASVAIDKVTWRPLDKYVFSKLNFPRLQAYIDSVFQEE